jgi:hypothetical protein
LDPGAAERRWVSQENQAEAHQIHREIADVRQTEEEGEHRMRTSTEALSEAKDDLQQGIADGTILPEETLRKRLAQCPIEVPGILWHILLSCTAVVAVLAVEGSQLAVVCWDSVGVDTSDLMRALANQPVSVIGAGLFGLGAAAALLFAAHLAVAKADSALYGTATVQRRLMDGAVSLVFMALVAVVLFYLSDGRHAAAKGAAAATDAMHGASASAGGLSSMAFFWVSLAFTVGAAFITHITVERIRKRREAMDERRKWFGDAVSENASRERAEELVANLEKERAAHKTLLDQASERLKALNKKAQEVEARLRSDYERRCKYAWAFANALQAALRRDHHYYNLFNRKTHSSGDSVADVSTGNGKDRTPLWENPIPPNVFHASRDEEIHS